jgi:hypothetical protein
LFIDFYIHLHVVRKPDLHQENFETATKINKEPVIIFGAGNTGQAILKTILYDQHSLIGKLLVL